MSKDVNRLHLQFNVFDLLKYVIILKYVINFNKLTLIYIITLICNSFYAKFENQTNRNS